MSNFVTAAPPLPRNTATQNPVSAAAAAKAGVATFGVAPEAALPAPTAIAPTTTPASPKAVRPTIDSALLAVEEGITQGAELLADKKELTNEIVSIQESVADATANKAAQDLIVLTQQATAALQTQNDARRIFQSAGGVDQLVKLSSDQKATSNNAIDQMQDVVDLEAVTISDDGFFTWLAARFQLEGEMAEADTAIKAAGVVNNAITNFTVGTNRTKAALADVSETRTTATVAAMTESAAQQSVILAGEARLKAKITKADQITEAMTATRQEVDAKILGYNLAVRADEIVQTDIDRAARRLEVGKSDKIDAAIIRGVQQGQIELGLAPSDDATILAMIKVKGPSSVRASSLFNLGTTSAASSASDTYLAYSLNNPAALIDVSNRSLLALTSSVNSIKEGLAGKGLNEEQLAVSIDKKVGSDFEKFSKNIKFGDSTNPNSAAPLPKLLLADSVKSEKLVIDVLAGLDLEDASPEQLLKIAISAVENKDVNITMNDAVSGIVAIYKQAVHLNNVEDNREALGIPVQGSYISNIDLPTAVSFADPNLFPGDKANFILSGKFFGDILGIDWLKPTDVMAALVKFKAMKAAGSPIFDKL